MIPGAEIASAAAHAQADRATLAWRFTLFALALTAVLLAWHPRRAIDLHVYLLAAERFLAGADLYRAGDGPMPFKYAPPSAWFFVPLSFLPTRVAAIGWDLGLVALFAWSVRTVSARLQPGRGAPWPWPWPWPWAKVAAVGVLAHPLYLELHYGQVDVAMLAALLGAWVLPERGRAPHDLLAGALIAVAALLKAPAAVVLIVPLLRGQGRVLLGFGLALPALTLPMIARYGLEATVRQTHAWLVLTQASTAEWITGHNPQGLPSLFLSWFTMPEAPPGPQAMLLAQLAAFAVIALAALAAHLRTSGTRPELVFAVACAGVALASPMGWRANFVLLLPLVLHALLEGRRLGRLGAVAFGAVGLTVNPWLWGRDGFVEVMLHRPFTWAALALLGAILVEASVNASAPASATRAGPLPALPVGPGGAGGDGEHHHREPRGHRG